MFVSRLFSVFDYFSSVFSGGLRDFFYRLFLFVLFLGFLGLRLPYTYGMGGFALFIFFIICPLFAGLFFSRVSDGGFSEFFSCFVPLGTPLWIAPFVCLAETLSYIVRPLVLMMRPFVNLSAGALGGYALGLLSLLNYWVVLFLIFLFFYEIFVAVVHWFIVYSILSFSEDH
uniref:ATP synthase F0 subunit 6 n=1 Tax=Metorchis xanthosomus TaxID=575209 RepID=UPI002551D62A|nr:ATP synthase F0 subunit 6 [Metorchis xanthosomus]WGM81704.1 ATP synthase F0 subunit 6 [Metorchis xanthosomus]